MSTTRILTMHCPSWCVEHEAGTETGTRRPVMDHSGPTFGAFHVEQVTHLDTCEAGPIEVRAFDLDDVLQSVESLRQLAADAHVADLMASQR